MNETLTFASQLAQKTGVLLMEYYQPGGINTSVKDDHSAVTEADLAADQLISDSIHARFPNDGLLTEEANTTYPNGKSVVWVVDPLDGTTNFSLGLHYWGVSIARLVNGEPDTAALYFPMLGELFTAQRGQGAYLNGDRLQTKAPDENQPFAFFACCSRSHRRYDIKIRYKTRILGSAAYGLVTVGRGSAVLALEATPKVWDFSASWLVTREAGGLIQVLDGNPAFPLIPGTDYSEKSFPILAAATEELWSDGQSKIVKKG
ncbi:MAG: inositol phosphatase [Chloroflexi bacterium]|nr:inositol phosphatase [Chloroflexota bacterium]